MLLMVDVFWCASSGDTLAFAHFGFSSHNLLTLDTLGTMCHLSLRVWKNTLFTVSFCLCKNFIFALLLILFCFKIFKFLHSAIERTHVRSIPDMDLRSSTHTLARV
jgi:hypothetical protein